MMLKTVYGLPPTDVERIEAAEEETDSALVREATRETAMAADKTKEVRPAAGSPKRRS
ncbi:hypothetical protein SPSIL_033610 [Sporomusa silvacetica DSM 10669]|uniref:Uncharacterized protein n=1 Tax=Sporomusa silvacetica DSM 10669 TaxID=1123289 RepID=A0ABZ3IN78_9FIRM|nr:hypothetical protein [Sporomusa silvacetica]OZC21294.1 hypothetical protein SPSIL_10880 [Sporomusa silvacetica DSM 10669]